MKRILKCLCLIGIAGCLLFAACGAPLGPASDAPSDMTPEITETDGVMEESAETLPADYSVPENVITEADEESLMYLYAVSASHEGYRTGFTPEDGEVYIGEHSLNGLPVSVFSDNGNAMVLVEFDHGMSQTEYKVYFTNDYGETWQKYAYIFRVPGYVAGMISDGKDYWAYGHSHVFLDSFITYIEGNVTGIMPMAFLLNHENNENLDIENAAIRSLRFGEETQTLLVEYDEQEYDPDTGEYRTVATRTREFGRDLSAE